jgi:hypothetical protein
MSTRSWARSQWLASATDIPAPACRPQDRCAAPEHGAGSAAAAPARGSGRRAPNHPNIAAIYDRPEVSNFRPSEESKGLYGDTEWEDPLDLQCARKTAVVHKKSAKLKCGFRLTLKPPNNTRSYKYDILGESKLLLDPEIEVRP